MKKIKLTIEPNIEKDVQTINFSDLDIPLDEWNSMNEDDKKAVCFELIADNLYGMITNIEEI